MLQGMAGDVNLFMNDHDDRHSAEIEVFHLPAIWL